MTNNMKPCRYEGLIDSVRRVDNFTKTKIEDMGVDNDANINLIKELIDNELLCLNSKAKTLTVFDDDFEAGEVYGAIEVLEDLLEKINKNIKGEWFESL